MMSKHKYCQSCGFPMTRDKQGGGTECDGSVSDIYCSMCYQHGKFTSPPWVDTAKKMQEYCMLEMRKAGYGRFFAWLATRSIPNLKRLK